MRNLLLTILLLSSTLATANSVSNSLDCQGRKCVNKEKYDGTSKRFELRLQDMTVGKCYVDTKDSTFYKLINLINKRNRNKLVFITEKQDGEYKLKPVKVLFESKRFNRLLKEIDCNSTPKLWDVAYIKKCTDGKVSRSQYFCEKPRKSNW